MTKAPAYWPTEAALVADFVAAVGRRGGWTVYPETCNWDLVLVREADGFQIGVEAKLSLNATVLNQALGRSEVDSYLGRPDCVAVLVPADKAVLGLSSIALRLGVVVIRGSVPDRWGGNTWNEESEGRGRPTWKPRLPQIGDEPGFSKYAGDGNDWPELWPAERLKLPAYIPDVEGGKPSPVCLTEWKIKAIKISVLLDVFGWVSKAEFKAISIDMSRWTQGRWSAPDPTERGRWKLPEGKTLGFREQHPRNYAEIAADIETWLPEHLKTVARLAALPEHRDGANV